MKYSFILFLPLHKEVYEPFINPLVAVYNAQTALFCGEESILYTHTHTSCEQFGWQLQHLLYSFYYKEELKKHHHMWDLNNDGFLYCDVCLCRVCAYTILSPPPIERLFWTFQ